MRPLPARGKYLLLALATIAAGLAVRGAGDVRDFTGDAIYGMMIAWWMGFITPRARLVHRAGAAIAVCFAIEFSQLIHTPALDAARSTLPGRLVLGSGFNARDLVAYAIGVMVATALEQKTKRNDKAI